MHMDFRILGSSPDWLSRYQVVFPSDLSLRPFKFSSQHDIFTNSLAIPAYVALLSIAVLVLQVVAASRTYRRIKARLFSAMLPAEEHLDDIDGHIPVGFLAECREHIEKHGGSVIFVHKIARLIGCSLLLALSIYSAIAVDHAQRNIDMVNTSGKWGKPPKSRKHHPDFTAREWLEFAMCMTYLYTSFLALVSVSVNLRWSRLVAKHLNTILLTTFIVSFYRDLLPLMMYHKSPKDLYEGRVLWIKVIILIFTSIVIPLSMPRQYIPVDPKSPMPVPNPEQTASLFSLMTYSFLNSTIFLAYRVPHLSHDQLPPLADYDNAKHLTERGFKHVDLYTNGRKDHLFWGLMRIFRQEYIILSVLVTLEVITSFASPYGIKELLRYLETHGKDATFRPWVWVGWLFVGPTLSSFLWQWYIYIATRTLVRAECIITQLVFEHSLRIRMKAETTVTPTNTGNSSPSSLTPDTISLVDEDVNPQNLAGSVDADTLQSRGETLQASSSSVKSSSFKKDKQKTQTDEDDESEGSSSASNLIGKINNLVTTDLGNIVESRDFLIVLIYIPLQIILCIIFLYWLLGWSAFVGLASILLLFPIPGYVAKRLQDVQVARLKKTDARVQTVTEVMNVLRMIKLFGWEKRMNEKVAEKRDEELLWVWKRQLLDLINGNLNFLIPVVTMTVIMKQQLSASIVFSSMTVFDMLRDQLHTTFYAISQFVTGKVSLDRVDDFLRNTELLDAYTKKTNEFFIDVDEGPSDEIGFRDATFTWSSDADGSLTPSKRNFMLKVEGELLFKRGDINIIVGPTGSGKTSLLMALLGEMHFVPSTPQSWYNLPRGAGVAYAAQESWVQNETIRANIVFGAPFDEVRYKKVLHQCCLERDLQLFEAGDQTEVGEKGLTLSGGQKARVTLARAIYSQAEIILLDDVLAALDVHTAKWIVDKCFRGDLIQGRTLILVTHNVAMVRPIAGFVVSMGSDGRILSQGSVSDALTKDAALAEEINEEEQVLHKAADEIDAPPPTEESKSDGKLILEEEIEIGHVSWSALNLYLQGLGGKHSMWFLVAVVAGLVLTEVSNTLQTWYLGYWAAQYEKVDDPSEVPVLYYLGGYGVLLLIAVALYCASYVNFVFGSLRASKSLHARLIESILGTTLRWLDVTPTSRVITRCTQDIRAVDGPIPSGLWMLAEMTFTMIIKFAAVIVMTPAFILPGILVAVIGGWCGQIYIAAQLSVKREMSNAKAPVLGHFGAAIAGITSIRAYGAEETFKDVSLSRINRYTRAARTFYNLNRWVCIRIDAIGGLFAASLAGYLVYFQNHSASNTGFALNMAVGFSGMILWWVRILNDFEVQGNSLERIQGYISIEQEPKNSEAGVPPAYWPASGDLRVENLSAKYSQDGPEVLHSISFHIKSGERIGVVGRTGSGKSSLTLSLLRCILTDGDVYYDNLKTTEINLDALRTNITIIPQVPELLSGSLRQNLDPFDQHDDATLNDALRSAGLFSLQNESDEGRITLDTQISSGGGNLSVGQRQIIALARAIVRRSKLLILDEATSAIDYKTDAIIQTSLRNELRGDVSLITVAHRLQTIMDADKIMVLDAGRITEYGSPADLLQLEGGKLRALVDQSGDKATLYAMAEGAATTSIGRH